jgi:hypothetical protein
LRATSAAQLTPTSGNMQHVIVLTLCLRVLPARLPCTPSHDSVRPRGDGSEARPHRARARH